MKNTEMHLARHRVSDNRRKDFTGSRGCTEQICTRLDVAMESIPLEVDPCSRKMVLSL